MNKIIFFILISLLISTIGLTKTRKGGELRTFETFTYGRFEVRYKPPAGEGVLATFFTYHEIEGVNEWNEIDIEIHGRYTNDVQVTTITPGQVWRNSHQWVNFNTHLDFHEYAFEWTPEYVAWFIDGVEVYRQKGAHIQTLTRDQKIMMNIWSSTAENWNGVLNDKILPVFAWYDWVSYASYTPSAGNTGTNNNFTLQWKDDFDFWDQNRWEKATHTFYGNNVDFIPENIVFKDGMMILCLTDNEETGFNDKNPPSVLWARANGNTVELQFSEEVDSNSAEKTSSYFIAGATISEAKLMPDQRTAKLTVSGIDPSQNYSLAILGIKDKAPEPNVRLSGVSPITIAQPLAFPVKINVGGAAIYQDFLPDQKWSPELEYGYIDGYEEQWPADIDIRRTEQDSIYLSERHEVVEYKIRAPNGHYQVSLLFAENKYDGLNKRLFDVIVEDSLIAAQLDLFRSAGRNVAYELKAENIVVTDEIIDIHFTNLIDYSVLNGIIVEQANTAVPSGKSHSPSSFLMLQNYPNPFNPETTFVIQIPGKYGKPQVSLKIYDILGRFVNTIIDKKLNSGVHRVRFDASDLAAGIYFCRMTVVNAKQVRQKISKITLLK